MAIDDVIELDARVAWVLSVGLPPAEGHWSRDEYEERALAVRRLGELARSGATVTVTNEQVARAAAELAGLNDPERDETIELLALLVTSIPIDAAAQRGYLIGGLHDCGWPTDPQERMLEHLTAAQDLGLFDPSDQLRRRRPCDDPPNLGRRRARLAATTVRLTPQVRQLGDRNDPQPSAERRVSLRERFLLEWEEMLGGIVDAITAELETDGLEGDSR